MRLGDTSFFNLFALVAGKKDAFRNGRWVHLAKGARGDVLKWFAKREAELEDES